MVNADRKLKRSNGIGKAEFCSIIKDKADGMVNDLSSGKSVKLVTNGHNITNWRNFFEGMGFRTEIIDSKSKLKKIDKILGQQTTQFVPDIFELVIHPIRDQ